jgi:hypothetical protein
VLIKQHAFSVLLRKVPPSVASAGAFSTILPKSVSTAGKKPPVCLSQVSAVVFPNCSSFLLKKWWMSDA